MPIRIRKSIYSLTTTERAAFFAAMQAIKTNGVWDRFIRMHGVAMGRPSLLPGETTDDTGRNPAHRGPAFPPWHRAYLHDLENELNAVAPAGTEITIPYWPWERDAALADPTTAAILGDDYLGQTNVCPFGAAGAPNLCRVTTGPAGAWDTLRERFQQVSPTSANLAADADGNPIPVLDADGDPTFVTGGQLGDFFRMFATDSGGLLRDVAGDAALPPQTHVDGVLQYTTYDRAPWDESVSGSATTGSFRNRLEGWAMQPAEPAGPRLHNAVHVWIGGDMGPGTSPNDPIFYLNHCNVDRLWARWQERRREVNPTYDADYLPSTGGPPGHNIDDQMFPWNGDPKFPGLATWTPRQTLDTVAAMQFIYDDVPRIRLRAQNLVFGGVIDGETSHRAATFDIVAAHPVTLTLEGFTAGTNGFQRPSGEPNPVVVTPSAPEWSATGYVWFAYRGGTGSGAPLTASIRARMLMPDGTTAYDRVFTVTMSASTIARPTLATALVLDQSGSMAWDAGNGNVRIDVLHFAAPPFVQLLDAGNGLGIVAFDHDAHPRMDVLPMPGAAGTATGIITTHMPNPLGGTSIADGIELARTKLDDVAASYTGRAMVVFTDGHETSERWLHQLGSAVLDGKVFAVALGTAEHIQPERLADIAASHGGYLLLTGELAANGDDDFLLSKYYLQILAGLTNLQVTLDPEGWVRLGEVKREPFVLSEADIRADVVLLTKWPFLDLRLETPSGDIVDPSDVGADVQIIEGDTMIAYRVRLPFGADHAGSWHAILRIDPRRAAKWLQRQLGAERLVALKADRQGVAIPEAVRRAFTEATRDGVRYSLVVQTWSNLRMQAQQYQASYEPGAIATIRAIVTEYATPIGPGTSVVAELRRPDGTSSTLTLGELEPGVFEGRYELGQPGVWRARVMASGRDRRGRPFTREQLLTASARRGGDRRDEPRPDGGGRPKDDDRWCRLLACLLGDKGIRELLAKHGVDPQRVAACVRASCRHDDTPPRAAIAQLLDTADGRAEIARRLAELLER